MNGQDGGAAPQPLPLAESGGTASGEAVAEAAVGPGAQLLAERCAQGLSLGDIARQLKLSVRQVEALERDDYQAFAGMVFVRGFVRNYAKLLQLDPEPLLAMTRSEAASGKAALPATASSGEARAPQVMLPPRRWLLAGVVLAGLVAAAIFESQRNQGPAPAQALPPAPLAADPQRLETPAATGGAAHVAIPAPDSDRTAAGGAAAPAVQEQHAPSSFSGSQGSSTAAGSPSAPAPKTASQAAAQVRATSPVVTAVAPQDARPAPAPGAVTGGGESQLKLVFEGPAWVEVRDASGTVIFSQLNDTGAERTVRGRPPLALVIGNAHAVRVSFRDQPIDLEPHTRVDVARLVLE